MFFCLLGLWVIESHSVLVRWSSVLYILTLGGMWCGGASCGGMLDIRGSSANLGSLDDWITKRRSTTLSSIWIRNLQAPGACRWGKNEFHIIRPDWRQVSIFVADGHDEDAH